MSRWDLTPSTPISFDDLDDLTPRLDLRDQRADAAGGATTDRAAAYGIDTRPDDPPEGERWSTWEDGTHGPHPLPDWVITAHGAVEQDLGILKSGKEADVHVIRRWLPDGSDTPAHDSYLAAKRFRSGEHRLFHRDAGYLEGRRVRRSREMRAMAKRTTFGREVISGQWSAAEFFALGTLWQLGIPVPYPVQLSGTEMLMEFIGTDGVAAPRLAATRPSRSQLPDLFEQLRDALLTLASAGWTHGDLSAFNILLHEDRLVLIDWPQIVDVIGNPQGFEFLRRDAHNMATWFGQKGFELDEEAFFGDLVAAATSRW